MSFIINYEILDTEKSRLSGINNIKEFELDLGDIEGQIQLIFNGTNEGFVNKEVPYDGELLFTWFQELNQVSIELATKKFVAMWMPDSANIWFEFKAVGEMLSVNQIKAQKTDSYKKIVTNTPPKREQLFWTEELKKDEFDNEVIQITQKFMHDVLSLNGLLVESKKFMELDRLFRHVRELYKKSKN